MCGGPYYIRISAKTRVEVLLGAVDQNQDQNRTTVWLRCLFWHYFDLVNVVQFSTIWCHIKPTVLCTVRWSVPGYPQTLCTTHAPGHWLQFGAIRQVLMSPISPIFII